MRSGQTTDRTFSGIQWYVFYNILRVVDVNIYISFIFYDLVSGVGVSTLDPLFSDPRRVHEAALLLQSLQAVTHDLSIKGVEKVCYRIVSFHVIQVNLF